MDPWQFIEDHCLSRWDGEALRQNGRALVFPGGDVSVVRQFGSARYRLQGGSSHLRSGIGVDGKLQVYLDITHLEPEVQHRLESVLDIYEKFTGDNPRKKPMKICPGFHYTMGGAWVDWPASDDPDRWTVFGK